VNECKPLVAGKCTEEGSALGPVTVHTPRGLGLADWNGGLEAYAARCVFRRCALRGK
jgi:hypothetical protein